MSKCGNLDVPSTGVALPPFAAKFALCSHKFSMGAYNSTHQGSRFTVVREMSSLARACWALYRQDKWCCAVGQEVTSLPLVQSFWLPISQITRNRMQCTERGPESVHKDIVRVPEWTGNRLQLASSMPAFNEISTHTDSSSKRREMQACHHSGTRGSDRKSQLMIRKKVGKKFI